MRNARDNYSIESKLLRSKQLSVTVRPSTISKLITYTVKKSTINTKQKNKYSRQQPTTTTALQTAYIGKSQRLQTS